ncbi:MAG: hypothetical protein A2381_19985 [Bdellovibrionales bacterium RIFOXYB1_FULL_37_110]|nr:MAG: hypothetical protein A2181_03620 [Bdellovibrionales bacterium RIFOXYA1_FULL_38_20]OFZ51018.1 MAG: hypothetical protein A2417_19770 [Bdellovibrionales bacterium RIFOXYC1_FULL_37_79]OFZ60230.1 MAG: hypothetical protein A2381_19985 [Bdellovibrionales bacterium RIFOXYB1_FULL_37_110]OFZ61592.1 MAG: hypothetical protein A2577_10425 [Bdellovibrionales bacterium RIFOXYD1_FULL_36_51]
MKAGHIIVILILTLVISSALQAKDTIVKSGECFTPKSKKNKHYAQSSNMQIPFIYLSGYKNDLADMAKEFNLKPEQLKEVETLKKVLGARIGKDLCLPINISKRDLKINCTGTILDGHIDEHTQRFYAKKFSCVKTVVCNLTDKENSAFQESYYSENVDLVIPTRCQEN